MIYRFVPHARAASYRDAGWIDRGDAPGHHGEWSRVMKWEGEGDPVEPPRAPDNDDKMFA